MSEQADKCRALIWEAQEFLDPAVQEREPEAAEHIERLCSALQFCCKEVETLTGGIEDFYRDAGYLRQYHHKWLWKILQNAAKAGGRWQGGDE